MSTAEQELKRAKQESKSLENQLVPLSAPSFATPSKRESFRLNHSIGGGATGDFDLSFATL